MSKKQSVERLSKISQRPDQLRATPQEIDKLLQALKSGVELSAEQHSILETFLSAAASREPEMVAQVVMQQEMFIGPLPHPEHLNGYDEDTRRQIVGMAVRDQEHTHSMQKAGLRGAILKDRVGQLCGVLIALSGLAAAAWISQFSAVAAGIIGTLDLVAMVCAFVAPRVLERAAMKAEQDPPQKPKAPRRKS